MIKIAGRDICKKGKIWASKPELEKKCCFSLWVLSSVPPPHFFSLRKAGRIPGN
jgi:hypothetical protein